MEVIIAPIKKIISNATVDENSWSFVLSILLILTKMFQTDKVASNNFVECRINELSGCIWNGMWMNEWMNESFLAFSTVTFINDNWIDW